VERVSPRGLGATYKQLVALIRASDAPDAAEVEAMVRAEWGSEVQADGGNVGNANAAGYVSTGDVNEPCNARPETTGGGYGTADYTRARLARDADPEKTKLPEDARAKAASVLSEVDSGQRSPNNAALEMGYRKKRGRVDQFKSLWRKASEEERAAIEEFIGDWRRGGN